MSVVARFGNLCSGSCELAESIRIGRGTMADYRSLGRHHYKSGRPMGATSIWTARLEQRTAVGRYLNRADDSLVAGVLICTLPRLSCRLRDIATGGRYLGLGLRARAQVLNREVRTIARVVVDPRLRGLGLAVKLVRHALDHADTVYTEALAAMGRVNPFFERAGMMRYDRPALNSHARLVDALAEVGIGRVDLGSLKRVESVLQSLTEAQRMFITDEIRRWHAQVLFVARDSVADVPLMESLGLAREQLHAQTVYYLHRADDQGGEE